MQEKRIKRKKTTYFGNILLKKIPIFWENLKYFCVCRNIKTVILMALICCHNCRPSLATKPAKEERGKEWLTNNEWLIYNHIIIWVWSLKRSAEWAGLLLTRYDMHEDCGEFVDEQHGGMVCYGQQQKENNCRSARHSQGYPRSKKISKPASKTQKPQVFCWTETE